MLYSHRPRATHAVIMHSVKLHQIVYSGDLSGCQGYLRRHDSPRGCGFVITQIVEDVRHQGPLGAAAGKGATTPLPGA